MKFCCACSVYFFFFFLSCRQCSGEHLHSEREQLLNTPLQEMAGNEGKKMLGSSVDQLKQADQKILLFF